MYFAAISLTTLAKLNLGINSSVETWSFKSSSFLHAVLLTGGFLLGTVCFLLEVVEDPLHIEDSFPDSTYLLGLLAQNFPALPSSNFVFLNEENVSLLQSSSSILILPFKDILEIHNILELLESLGNLLTKYPDQFHVRDQVLVLVR